MGALCGKGAGSNSAKYELRVLVLGVAGCGKSTFARQMKILYCDGFSDDELTNYKNILMQNLFIGLKEIVSKAQDSDAKLDKKAKKAASFFLDANPYTTQVTPEVVAKAKSVLDDEAIKKIFHSMGKFEYTESLDYCVANLDRISGADFTPTNDDVLHVRQRTTGIVETKFRMDKYNWTLIDVGGQKVERRKWTHSTNQHLNALIYFVALDEFDIPSEEDNSKTKMQESLEVWAETVNGEAIKTHAIPVILFLNKKDLFEEKIKEVSLKKTYKKYKGKDDPDKGIEYIRDLFLEKIQDGNPINAEELYVHATCAVDSENIKLVFEAVKDFIFRQRLKISGL